MRNFKQTAAMQAGIDAARGDVIATLDGDLQDNPEDIPALLAKIDQGNDMVNGWRVRRQDTFTLAPWKPALEPFKGRAVSGMIGQTRVSWTLDRGRSLPGRA